MFISVRTHLLAAVICGCLGSMLAGFAVSAGEYFLVANFKPPHDTLPLLAGLVLGFFGYLGYAYLKQRGKKAHK
jgi:hypothetical protein